MQLLILFSAAHNQPVNGRKKDNNQSFLISSDIFHFELCNNNKMEKCRVNCWVDVKQFSQRKNGHK